MEYAKNLYLSEDISEKKATKIISKVKKQKRINDVLFLTCIEESKNPMEIVSAVELYRSMNRENHILIVGISNNMASALELVRKIYDDVYNETSNVDLDNFFKTS